METRPPGRWLCVISHALAGTKSSGFPPANNVTELNQKVPAKECSRDFPGPISLLGRLISINLLDLGAVIEELLT